uniref:Uncharacterized protein n=1 Tax=Myotis myotis TaxID=51298 RepID=A0A7J7Z4F3_MYOMY|nr:hypothetical protein mMyoMyo1_010542 [Myotis myotis]
MLKGRAAVTRSLTSPPPRLASDTTRGPTAIPAKDLLLQLQTHGHWDSNPPNTGFCESQSAQPSCQPTAMAQALRIPAPGCSGCTMLPSTHHDESQHQGYSVTLRARDPPVNSSSRPQTPLIPVPGLSSYSSGSQPVGRDPFGGRTTLSQGSPKTIGKHIYNYILFL